MASEANNLEMDDKAMIRQILYRSRIRLMIKEREIQDDAWVIQAKDQVDSMINQIIKVANVRRTQLFDAIDNDAIRRKQTNLQAKFAYGVSIVEDFQDFEECSQYIPQDFDFEANIKHLTQILDTIKNESEPQQYIKKIRHGLKEDKLVFAGYMRDIPTHKPENVESLCFNYYSLNLHTSEQDKQSEIKEKKFEDCCNKMKKILGDAVEDVIIDDFHHRDYDRPIRIIDHSLNYSLFPKPTLITLAINPEHEVTKLLFNRLNINPEDETVEELVFLLYETHLAACGYPLKDSYWCNVHSIIERVLAININVSDHDQSSESDDSTTYSNLPHLI